jgi:hypothetical protein
MWNLVSVCLDTVLVSVQDRCMVCAKRAIGSEIILDAPHGTPLVRWVMWNLISVHLDILLVSAQDRCMVCAKHTIGLEIILDAPDGTPR